MNPAIESTQIPTSPVVADPPHTHSPDSSASDTAHGDEHGDHEDSQDSLTSSSEDSVVPETPARLVSPAVDIRYNPEKKSWADLDEEDDGELSGATAAPAPPDISYNPGNKSWAELDEEDEESDARWAAAAIPEKRPRPRTAGFEYRGYSPRERTWVCPDLDTIFEAPGEGSVEPRFSDDIPVALDGTPTMADNVTSNMSVHADSGREEGTSTRTKTSDKGQDVEVLGEWTGTYAAGLAALSDAGDNNANNDDEDDNENDSETVEYNDDDADDADDEDDDEDDDDDDSEDDSEEEDGDEEESEEEDGEEEEHGDKNVIPSPGHLLVPKMRYNTRGYRLRGPGVDLVPSHPPYDATTAVPTPGTGVPQLILTTEEGEHFSLEDPLLYTYDYVEARYYYCSHTLPVDDEDQAMGDALQRHMRHMDEEELAAGGHVDAAAAPGLGGNHRMKSKKRSWEEMLEDSFDEERAAESVRDKKR
ncbi:hypothetical protein QBC39DRAFT_398277 [Podospora conica]|nr:hypothetical protein QBC39DRAFT_398277 [Schizothecium conicum]